MRADRHWVALILGWAALQVAWRFAQGPALELDEAEAFWFARELRLGYNPQPPLYFWLQWAAFQLFGETLFALALLKNALLAGGALALYATLRRLRPPSEAGLAVAALGLLPQVLWEAQRALTHSVLALVMALAIMALADRALSAPARRRDWAALGLAVGLGALAKWNVALLPAALLLAALSHRGWRARLSPAGLALAGAFAALVLAAPLAWVLDNPGIAGGSLHKLEAVEAGDVAALAAGLGSLGAAWIAFCALPLLLIAGIARATRGRGRWRPDPQARLMLATMAAGAALLALGVAIAGATEIRDRWLIPVAVFAGPLAGLHACDRLGPRGRRRLAAGLAALWALAIALLPLSGRVDPGWRSTDFAALADRLEAEAPGAPVIADGTWIAGNLARLRPGLDLRLDHAPGRIDGTALWVSRDGDAAALARRAGHAATPLVPLDARAGRRAFAFGIALGG